MYILFLLFISALTAFAAGDKNEVTQRLGNASEALHEIRTSVVRMERGFTLLGDRLNTQNEILGELQTSYTEKEQKLQATLRAVIDAVNEIRRSRSTAGAQV